MLKTFGFEPVFMWIQQLPVAYFFASGGNASANVSNVVYYIKGLNTIYPSSYGYLSFLPNETRIKIIFNEDDTMNIKNYIYSYITLN